MSSSLSAMLKSLIYDKNQDKEFRMIKNWKWKQSKEGSKQTYHEIKKRKERRYWQCWEGKMKIDVRHEHQDTYDPSSTKC